MTIASSIKIPSANSNATIDNKVTYNNLPTAFLKIRKNTQDDSLRILETVKQFISDEKRRLPAQVQFNQFEFHRQVNPDFVGQFESLWFASLARKGVIYLAIDNFPIDSEEPVIRELGRTQDVVTIALSANLPK
jgi:multidrug efflux pump subunit AcrB